MLWLKAAKVVLRFPPKQIIPPKKWLNARNDAHRSARQRELHDCFHNLSEWTTTAAKQRPQTLAALVRLLDQLFGAADSAAKENDAAALGCLGLDGGAGTKMPPLPPSAAQLATRDEHFEQANLSDIFVSARTPCMLVQPATASPPTERD